MKVHVVMGTTGEYSDRDEWLVRAFVSRRRAEKFALACKVRANEIVAKYPDSRWDIPKGEHEMDPGFRADYTGTDYFVCAETELDEESE